jgi:hypothetical protein
VIDRIATTATDTNYFDDGRFTICIHQFIFHDTTP